MSDADWPLVMLVGWVLACNPGCVPQMVPVNNVSEAAPMVRVSLDEIDRELFQFTIVNYSTETLYIDRNAISLATPDGVRWRRAGGWKSAYALPPGGAHAVNLHFDLGGIRRGDRVSVCFTDAVRLAGYSVDVPAMEFVAR